MSGWVKSISKDRITLDLDFEDVEFIGMELPPGDGFTRDWWASVWNPMIKLREEPEDDDRPGISIRVVMR